MPATVYYYTPPHHVLKNLADGRIKISSFAGCNDPFELAGFNMQTGARYDERRRFRARIRDWQCRQERTHGLICFSTSWRSPLMWAHYAKDHTGLCLEFAIDRDRLQRAGHALLDVKYTPRRIQLGTVPPELEAAMPTPQLQSLCATKFSHWRYEKEVRLLLSLRDRRIVIHHHMRFMPFGECLELKRIFMGPRSQHYLECIEDALGTNDIPILQTRAAYSRFAIVLQRDRKYWKSREIREQPVDGSHSSH